MKSDQKPFFETVAEKLIEQLREGTAPWQKPWEPGEAGTTLPLNPATGKRYRGINAVHLMSQGRSDQRWMTYKQAAALDAQVRKGEKGTPIQYWKFTEEQTKLDAAGKPMFDNGGDPIKETVKLERPRVFFATVFNAEQIDGLPPLAPRKQHAWSASERAEQILQASGAAIRHGEQDRAFYRPATDSIHLPDKAQFPTSDAYYATALHELGHWTGHESRLARDLIHPFGSEGYAKEELRAEIASMILGDELGIGHDPGQHAAYVGSWIKALQDDPLEIFRAAADAEKIQEYVLGLEQQQQQEQTSTQAIAAAEHPEAFIDTHGMLRDWTTADRMTDDWQGVVKNEGAFWYAGRKAGERSLTVLAATTLEDAKAESERVKALAVDIGAVLDNPDVSFSHYQEYQGKNLDDALRGRGLTTIGNVTGNEPARFYERAEDRLSAVFGLDPGRMGVDNAYLERKGLAQEFASSAERIMTQLRLQFTTEATMSTAQLSATNDAAAFDPDGFGLRVYDAGSGGQHDIPHPSLESAIDAFVAATSTRGQDQWARVLQGDQVLLELDNDLARLGVPIFGRDGVSAAYQQALIRAAAAQQPAPTTSVQATAEQEAERAQRAEGWTLRHVDRGTLPRALDNATLAQLNRVQDVLFAMKGLNPANEFWQRHELPEDLDAFDNKLYEANELVTERQGDWHVAAARLELVTGYAFGRARTGDGERFDQESQAKFGFTLPRDWTGTVQVQGNVSEEVDGQVVVTSALAKGKEPESWGVYAQQRDGTYQLLADRESEQEANKLAERLALVDARSTISEREKAAKLARVHEMRVRRDPNSTDEDISAAKETRKHAEFVATEAELQQKAEYQEQARAIKAAATAAVVAGAASSAREAVSAPAAPTANGATNEKTLIDVPYKEKSQAKELGAMWDRQQQSWYIPAGVDPAPFAKWVQGATKKAASDVQASAATEGASAVPDAPSGRAYLAVPYADRTAAKAAGALWDNTAKSWYAGPNADMAKLEKWRPENVPVQQAPAMTPREEFTDALKSIGCVISGEHPVMDGKKHRITVEGEKFSKNSGSGFYVGHVDGHPAGYMKNNKTGAELTWKSKGYTLDPEQKAQLAAQAAERLQQREAELTRLQTQAAKRVVTQTDKLHAVEQPTPYMLAKNIEPHAGVLTDKDGKKTYIPAVDADGKQWTMQYIQTNGTKRFAKDSRKEGCFHVVGGMDELAKAPVIVIGEGYATAATLKQSLGFATVSAFDSGNLAQVAQSLHGKYPGKPIVIAGDDDRHLELTQGINPGRTKAEQAAALVGGKVLMPIFAPGEATYPAGLDAVTPEAYRQHQSDGKTLSAEQLAALDRMKQYTDFNDLATKSALGQEGLDRQVRALVEATIAKHQGVQVDQQQDLQPDVQEQMKVQAIEEKPKRQRRTAKVA
jgi:putative DNA primase/helicase